MRRICQVLLAVLITGTANHQPSLSRRRACGLEQDHASRQSRLRLCTPWLARASLPSGTAGHLPTPKPVSAICYPSSFIHRRLSPPLRPSPLLLPLFAQVARCIRHPRRHRNSQLALVQRLLPRLPGKLPDSRPLWRRSRSHDSLQPPFCGHSVRKAKRAAATISGRHGPIVPHPSFLPGYSQDLLLAVRAMQQIDSQAFCYVT